MHVERLIMFLYKETLTFYALSKYSAANIVTEWRVSACIVQTLTSICKIKPDLSGLLILFGDFNFLSSCGVFLLLRRIYTKSQVNILLSLSSSPVLQPGREVGESSQRVEVTLETPEVSLRGC